MSMDNLDLNRIRNYITCSLCSKLTKDPRILDCYHSFCLNCLRDRCQIKDYLDQALANCPQCQATFEIPKGGLEYLRKNDFKAKIYETYKMLCEICSNMAERRCEECNQIFCEMCSSLHLKFNATKGHILSPLSDTAPENLKKSEYTVCHEHASNVNMFCSVCSEFVCINCFTMKHNGHQVKLISNKFHEVKKHLSDIVDRKNETLSKLAAEREVVVPLRYQSSVKAEDLRHQIRARGEALKSIADNHVSVLCKEVDANLDTYHAKVDTLVEALDTLKTKVEAEMKDIQAKIRDLDFRTVIGYAKQEEGQPEPKIPSFQEVFNLEFRSTNDQEVLSLANVVGTVSDGTAVPQQPDATGQAPADTTGQTLARLNIYYLLIFNIIFIIIFMLIFNYNLDNKNQRSHRFRKCLNWNFAVPTTKRYSHWPTLLERYQTVLLFPNNQTPLGKHQLT